MPQETWANPEAFKKWAEDKLESIINTQNDFELKEDFKATGQFAHYNNARKEGIKNWYKYLTEEKKLCDQYEKSYGPLTTDSKHLGDNSWKWIKSPWPWEGTK